MLKPELRTHPFPAHELSLTVSQMQGMLNYVFDRHRDNQTNLKSDWEQQLARDGATLELAGLDPDDQDLILYKHLSPMNALNYCILGKMDSFLLKHCVETMQGPLVRDWDAKVGAIILAHVRMALRLVPLDSRCFLDEMDRRKRRLEEGDPTHKDYKLRAILCNKEDRNTMCSQISCGCNFFHVYWTVTGNKNPEIPTGWTPRPDRVSTTARR